jgi:hypothetical protein
MCVLIDDPQQEVKLAGYTQLYEFLQKFTADQIANSKLPTSI